MTSTEYERARAAVRAGADPVEAARAVVATMTPEERLWCLDGDAPTWAGLGFLADDGYHLAPFSAAEVPRVGFPGIHFADGPRGCVVGNATCFPVSMARGATWDPDLEERVGEVIGRELSAAGADLTGAVCVNVLRHPAWGRAQETYGEDPFHVGELGAAFTRGLQRHVMACAKHFACNSMENARFSVDVQVDEVALHEIYLPQFRRIVAEGVASLMSAYNSLDGEWCGQNADLLTGVLRDEWGFDGFVISDWIFGLRDAAASLRAGLDVEMPYRMIRCSHLRPALDRGEVTWAQVDAAVVRLVATRLRFEEALSAGVPDRKVLGAPEHRALAREVAARSVVLLRNEVVSGAPVLPLREGSRVALIGRLADTVNLGDGGSSDVWDLECRTVLDGLVEAGLDVAADGGDDPASAAAVAAEADVALVVVGYTFLDEGEYIGGTDPALAELLPAEDEPEVVEAFAAWVAELPPTEVPERMSSRPKGFSRGGDRTSLRLAAKDVALIEAVAAANPATVVAIQAGSAVVMTEWVDSVATVVQAWYGGCEAGPGLADVLVGAVDPSARLPFSIPTEESDLPPFERDATSAVYDRWHGWWHLRRTGRPAVFPFGFGLSYTTFAVEAVAVECDDADGTLVVKGVVRNTGGRDGAEVVQVYARLPEHDAPERLVGFARVEVAAGDAAPFEVRVPSDRLETRDPEAHSWRPPRGRCRITVARHAEDPAAVSTEIDV
jgi:beta-glucosidase